MRYAIVLWLLLTVATVTNAQQATPPLNGTNLENVTYPYDVQYLSLNAQGEQLRMAYMDVKPANPNGRTLLLLHGKNFNGAYWEQTARDLQREGYRLIIPDQIGFGKSSKPKRIQYSFPLLASQTKTLLDTLKVAKIIVLGHSMGGMLATRFALMYPDVTEKLVLENPIGLEDWRQYVPYMPVEEWYREELKQTYESIRQYQLTFYYDNKWKPAYDRWVNMLAGWTTNVDYPRIAWNSALLYDMIFTQPVCYEFDQLRMSVLLIIGQRDRTALGKNKAPAGVRDQLGNYPALGKKTAALIKGSTLVEIDGIGHLPHIEAYEKFIAPLKAFLKK